MLQRIFVHVLLVVLFAFTQMGVTTHEISHAFNQNQHSHADKKSSSKHAPTEQCEQCLSYAKVANGLHFSAFSFAPVQTHAAHFALPHVIVISTSLSAYAARAPPLV